MISKSPVRVIGLFTFFLAACSDPAERQLVLDAPPDAIMSEEALNEININIVISADNEVSINDTPVAFSELHSKLTELQAEIETPKILVMANPKAKNRIVIDVVDTAREFGDVGFGISTENN